MTKLKQISFTSDIKILHIKWISDQFFKHTHLNYKEFKA